MDQDFLIQDHVRAERQQDARKFLQRKARKPLWREYLETAVIAVIAAVLLRVFVVSAYRVNSASMSESLLEGDFIFVNKLAYKYAGKTPLVNDIIVFKYPNNPDKDYIKRVIALPGQTVQMADKVLYVDGRAFKEPNTVKYTDQRVMAGELSPRDNFGPFRVPEGEYFVMGDNRDDSRDSRFWGSVPADNILGKAVFVYWSWEPDASAPGWEAPYVIDLVHWLGWGIVNFPSHVRWDRLMTSI